MGTSTFWSSAQLALEMQSWGMELDMRRLNHLHRPQWGDNKGPCLYSSAWAAATKYHRLDDLKQQKCIFSQFWRPEVQGSFWGLWGRLYSPLLWLAARWLSFLCVFTLLFPQYGPVSRLFLF
jgi:hypothetical protein